MKSGYVITKDADAAFLLYELDEERVRFAAALSDGSGFVAFDGDVPIGWGDVYLMEPHPDYPPSWPRPDKQFPKRAIATDEMTFTLLPLGCEPELVRTDAVYGLAYVLDLQAARTRGPMGRLLVESHGPIAFGVGVWSADVLRFRQRRWSAIGAAPAVVGA